MVPFAYRLYQCALKCDSDDRVATQKRKQSKVFTNGKVFDETDDEHQQNASGATNVAINGASNGASNAGKTSNISKHRNIKVFFLGMWDCANSVAVVERSAPAPVEAAGTAQYVRQAVAVDERCVKFKPARWMIREADLVGKMDKRSAVHWCPTTLKTFKDLMDDDEKATDLVIKGFMHDYLSFGHGTALFKMMMWKLMGAGIHR